MENSEGAPVAETAKTSNGPLLIFGQGPVIDKVTRTIPQRGLSTSGNEDVNLWSKNIALAAAKLFALGQASEITVMGGRTGGEKYKSEAELIKRYLTKEGVPEGVITTEESSQDTITNLINMINMKDSQDKVAPQIYQILAAPYHISRVKILMQLFRVPFNHVFASDEMLRFIARSNTSDLTAWNTNLLSEIEMRLDSSDNRYYQQKQGTEKRDYLDRLVTDDVFIRELLQYPESWLGRVAEIQSESRRDEILEEVEKLWPGILQQKFGINRKLNSPNEIKVRLSQIQKKPLSRQTLEQWIEENKTIGWPKEVGARLHALLEERREPY